MPDGKLIYSNSKGYYKYYISDGKEKLYIPKSDKQLAEELAYKEYLKRKCNLMEQRLYRIRAANRKYVGAEEGLMGFLTNPAYTRLLENSDLVSEFKQDDWAADPFSKNPYKREKLVHDTVFGIKVRSKSESMIAIMLAEYNIPFLYEAPLVLKSGTKYPDFTVKVPRTNEIKYWEHFGWMDDEGYAYKNEKKVMEYAANGIMLGDNLVATFERQTEILKYTVIRRTIETNFL